MCLHENRYSGLCACISSYVLTAKIVAKKHAITQSNKVRLKVRLGRVWEGIGEMVMIRFGLFGILTGD